MSRHHRKFAVIGGGIQGSCVALEAAHRGVEVHLFEASAALMTGASLYNEGKIHLGYVYARDTTLETADLQARGAATFAPLMQRWLGDRFDADAVSVPFNYVVHAKSQLTGDELQVRYKSMSRLVRKHCTDGSYFGIEDPGDVQRWTRDEIESVYDTDAQAVFSTREIAVDPKQVAGLLVEAVESHPLITTHLSTAVRSVDPSTRALETGDDGTRIPGFAHIVNCAWAGRLDIDNAMGLLPSQPWSYRMKYYVQLTDAVRTVRFPSTTIVLGGFGDIVDYDNGVGFLSWYPVSRRGFSSDIAPPHWPVVPPRETARVILEGVRNGLRPVFPGIDRLLANYASHEVRGGVIYAVGATDIDDPVSMLHVRSLSGPRSTDWYHTVDTGKYTTAPLFAMETVNRIVGPSS